MTWFMTQPTLKALIRSRPQQPRAWAGMTRKQHEYRAKRNYCRFLLLCKLELSRMRSRAQAPSSTQATLWHELRRRMDSSQILESELIFGKNFGLELRRCHTMAGVPLEVLVAGPRLRKADRPVGCTPFVLH